MSSEKARQRKQLALEVEKNGIEMAPCSKCKNAKVKAGESKPKCILGRSSRCSECIRKGYTDCDVTVSAPEWRRLRDLREKIRGDLEKAEEEEVGLLHRLSALRAKKLRLRKQLRHTGRRVDKAVDQELADLEAADLVENEVLGPMPEELGDMVEVSDPPFMMHDILQMSPGAWDRLMNVPLDDPFAAG